LAGFGFDRRRIGIRLRLAAGYVDMHRGDGALGHALGSIDGESDGALGLIEIDDGAIARAARGLATEAEDAQSGRFLAVRGAPVLVHHLTDDAADLGAADIEGGDEAGPAGGLAFRIVLRRQLNDSHATPLFDPPLTIAADLP